MDVVTNVAAILSVGSAAMTTAHFRNLEFARMVSVNITNTLGCQARLVFKALNASQEVSARMVPAQTAGSRAFAQTKTDRTAPRMAPA